MVSHRWLTSWAALSVAGCCCLVPRSSWGHRQQITVTSAFIKRGESFLSERRRGCPPRGGEKECSATQTLLKLSSLASSPGDIPSSISSSSSISHDVVLNTRGGSSSSPYGGDDYNNNDGYGKYQDDNNNNNNRVGDDGYYGRRNDGNYDDRDPGYSPSYPSGSGSAGAGRDRYYDDDYYGREPGGGGGGGNGYYDDEGRYREGYDDRGGKGSSSSRLKSKTKLPTALTSSNRKLGVILLSSGAVFTILGITLFFNKTLMRLGNLLFVAGVPMMIGPGRTVGYFLQPKKARATGCLGCGIFLVMVGHPVIGIVLEIFGLLNLFGNMFPLIIMMAKNLPVVGGLFGGNGGGGKGGGGGGGGKRRESRYDDDRYYEDEGYERDYRRDERY